VDIKVAGQAGREAIQEHWRVRRRVTFLALGLEFVLAVVTLGAGYLGMAARRGAPLADNLAVAGVAGFCGGNFLVPVNLQRLMHLMALGTAGCSLAGIVWLMAGCTLRDKAMACVAA